MCTVCLLCVCAQDEYVVLHDVTPVSGPKKKEEIGAHRKIYGETVLFETLFGGGFMK